MGKSRTVFFLAVLLLVSGCASRGGDPYNRAVEHYSMGRIGKSIDYYKQAIRQEPNDPRPRFNLAVIYQDEGRLREAEALYMTILEQNPDYSPAWSNLASILEKRGQAEGAEKAYRRAMEANRDDAWAASQFGYFLMKSGRRDEAAATFGESVRRDSRCANGWYGLGLIEEEKGDYKAAVRSFERALIYNPSDIQAYLRAANIRIAQGDRGAAIGLLRKAVTLKPGRGDIHFLLGRLLREEGKFKAAEKALEEAAKAGAPQRECERELSIVYGKLWEEASAKACAEAPALPASGPSPGEGT
ncbi:MAG: tetratricopeptide repeat protein [Syntrophobacteraceae bacterium]